MESSARAPRTATGTSRQLTVSRAPRALPQDPHAAPLTELITALATMLELRRGTASEHALGGQLLDLEETAQILGVSRMTVARMADEGHLPSVVIRRGRVQKVRRIPRAFVERMVADAAAGAEVDVEEYTIAWLADRAALDH